MKTGDKVVCVDDEFPQWVRNLYTALPVEGQVYVIRSVTGGVTHEGGRRPSDVILLVGVINPVGKASGQELGFQPKRFRPLEELNRRNRCGKEDEVTSKA